MIAEQDDTPLADRGILLLIAAIPSIDCICDQLNNAFQLHIGPVSFLQVLRGFLLLIFLAVIAAKVWRDRLNLMRIPLPAVGALMILGLAVSKEMLVTGSVSGESIGAYGQMFYWVTLWSVAMLVCREPRQAEVLMKGLVTGALLTAFSVILGILVGAGNYYKTDDVDASAGWFDTAKMITGILVAGGVITLYLGQGSRRWLAAVGACICFSACVLTYARAGEAALLVALTWLASWMFFLDRGEERSLVNRMFALLLMGCLALPLVVNTHELFARWSDMQSSDTAGSGRATFWRIALNAYTHENAVQQATGIGYKAMSEMLFRDYGDDIKHTHNDTLDLLLVAGAAGGLWLASLMASFAWTAFLPPLRSAAGAAAIAVFLTYLVHSQLTGQIWGTDAMAFYTLSLTALSRMQEEKQPEESVVKRPFRHYEALIEV